MILIVFFLSFKYYIAKIITDPDDLTILTKKSQYITQIDLIHELKLQQQQQQRHSNQRSYYGLLLDQQRNVLHLSSTDNDNDNDNGGDHNIDSLNRQIRFSDDISRRAIQVIKNNNDVTFLITIKQHRHNTGVIFAFTNGIHR